MPRDRRWMRGATLIALGMIAAGALSVGPVTAAKKPLTKKKALKLFYPRPEADARFLTGTEADATYLPSTGEIHVQAPPHMWVAASQATGVPEPESDLGTTVFTADSQQTGIPYITAPTLPTLFAGQNLELLGVNACYFNDPSPDPSTTLSAVRIWHTSNDNGIANNTDVFSDSDDRTTNDCEDFMLPSPLLLQQEDSVTLEFTVDHSGAGASFSPRRATFILGFA